MEFLWEATFSMSSYRLPDFLIVGTMKSGTTTLASYLNQNRSIHIPRDEIHYFNNEDNYEKGPKWYSQQLLNGIADFESPNLIGEKTPGYSYRPYCAQRIKDLTPDVKLIWIFREPVKRAYSNYLHSKKNGLEIRSFSYCVRHEAERMRKDITKGFVERSKYVLQIERLTRLFSLENMHFLLFEDMVGNPSKVLNEVNCFLGAPTLSSYRQIHSNKTLMPFSCLSLYLVRRLVGSNSKIYKMSARVNTRLARFFPRKPESIPPDIENELRLQLQPYNRRLHELTGLDLSPWESLSKDL